jgi:hypothetical protein
LTTLELSAHRPDVKTSQLGRMELTVMPKAPDARKWGRHSVHLKQRSGGEGTVE